MSKPGSPVEVCNVWPHGERLKDSIILALYKYPLAVFVDFDRADGTEAEKQSPEDPATRSSEEGKFIQRTNSNRARADRRIERNQSPSDVPAGGSRLASKSRHARLSSAAVIAFTPPACRGASPRGTSLSGILRSSAITAPTPTSAGPWF